MKWKYLALLISKLDINQFNFVVEKFNYKNNIFFNTIIISQNIKK